MTHKVLTDVIASHPYESDECTKKVTECMNLKQPYLAPERDFKQAEEETQSGGKGNQAWHGCLRNEDALHSMLAPD